jgi:hypothetical protein
MAKKMFKGMRFCIALEMIGNIVETNATFREGNVITLVDMDFGALVEDAEKLGASSEKLQRLGAKKPETVEEMKALMKQFPGFRMELNREVTVKFR